MIYIPIRSDAAPYFSAAIYQLTRPAETRVVGDVSAFFCAWHIHPRRPDVATLEIPEESEIPLHSAADADLLRDLLSTFVSTGDLTQTEVDQLVATVTKNAGQRVQVADLVPASWRSFVMNEQQAISGGWLETKERNHAAN